MNAKREWTSPENADSLETSILLLEAILAVARGDEAEAALIWESPSPAELGEIVARLENAGIPCNTLCWGDSGREWAKDYWQEDDDTE